MNMLVGVIFQRVIIYGRSLSGSEAESLVTDVCWLVRAVFTVTDV